MNWRSATLALASVAFSLTRPTGMPKILRISSRWALRPCRKSRSVWLKPMCCHSTLPPRRESGLARAAAVLHAPFAFEPLVVGIADEVADVDDAGRYALVLAEGIAIPIGHVPGR